mmetsp:Transcript_28270/g.48065  ORF Transcript_28270/g.48065 Transcript_28270/m.48065 type:complete len:213 (-) Transcript_28270:723-1361(-)
MSRAGAVCGAKAKDDLVGTVGEEIVGNVAVDPTSVGEIVIVRTSIKSVDFYIRESIVKLRHEKIQQIILLLQNLIILFARRHIAVHGRVRQLLMLRGERGVQLVAKFLVQRAQKVFCPRVGIRGRPAGTIGAVAVVAVFVIDIDPVEALRRHDVHELRGEMLFLPEAIVPASVGGGAPRSAHAGASEAEQDLLPRGLPLRDEGRFVLLFARR